MAAHADVVERQALVHVDRVRFGTGLQEAAKRLVVVAAARDRLVEQRGVARHTREAVLVDQPTQFPGGEQLTADVVEPHRLARGVQFFQRVHDLHSREARSGARRVPEPALTPA